MRNFLRSCNLANSLLDLWQISNDLDEEKQRTAYPIPNQKLSDGLLKWDIPDLVREVVLHSTLKGTERLDNRPSLSRAVSHLRNVKESAVGLRIGTQKVPEDILDEILRVAQQQFPWQQQNTDRALLRYLKIFSAPQVAPFVEAETSLTISEFFFLGIAVTGSLIKRPLLNREQSYEDFGISKAKSTEFFKRISTSVDDLRGNYQLNSKFDKFWDLQWSPLEATPLIAPIPFQPNFLFCPVPVFMKRRFSSSLYYDLCRNTKFGNAFGKAFEEYLAEVIQHTFPVDKFTIHPERPYIVKGNTHHGPDQIITDSSANLFLECKTKRLTRNAKIDPGSSAMHTDITLIAEAVVQNYQNILEAEQGISHWQPNRLPSLPLVVTLEDWFFMGVMNNLLASEVVKQLKQEGMDPALPQRMPYSVMSAKEFEDAAGIISKVGLKTFFFGIRDKKFDNWRWHSYMTEQFPNSVQINYFELFSKDFLKVLPESGVPEKWRAAWGANDGNQPDPCHDETSV